jgi:protein-tyrosine-phosphatase
MHQATDKLRIVFICSGNICRSPMAEAIGRQLLFEGGIPTGWVESAGTLGIEGQPASEFAIKAVGELGLDLSGHRSQGVSARHLDEADYLVAMAPEHAREVWMQRPATEPRIVRLWIYTTRKGRLQRIDDPIGKSYEVYVEARDNIRECLQNWIGALSEEYGTLPTDPDSSTQSPDTETR